MTTRDKAKWLRFLILILGGGTIYKLANLKDAFYVPMQTFMGLTHTEIGLLLSANAIIATALFVVGGRGRFVRFRGMASGKWLKWKRHEQHDRNHAKFSAG